MKLSLYKNPKIEIKKSSIHGWGVFAKEDIKFDEVLEECHGLIIEMDYYKIMMRYKIKGILCNAFNIYNTKGEQQIMIPYGFGCMYNSSRKPNIKINYDSINKIMTFKSRINIKSGSELFHNYEDSREEFKIRGISL